jgi:type III secretion inner rod protein HrpB2
MEIGAIEAVDTTLSHQLLDQGAQAGPDLQSLSTQFDRLMANVPEATQHNLPHNNDRSTAATEFIRREEELFRQTVNDVQRFIVDAPHMNAREVVMRQMDLTLQVTLVQFQFNAGVYVAQSSKNGLQTLMKNQ